MLQEEEPVYHVTGNIKEVLWPPAGSEIIYDEEGQPVQIIRMDNVKGPYGGQNPPTTMPLRQEAPVNQTPAPVVNTQPVVKIAAPIRMRGDAKWPPASTRPVEDESEKTKEAVKPKRQQKDYTAFFSQNQLPMTYPSYRAPPGTQHFAEEYSDV